MAAVADNHDFLQDRGDPLRNAQERRVAVARETEHVRLALRSVSRHGYYVFDALATEEAGLLDYAAVGPLGLIAILVRTDRGCVGFGACKDEILLDGKPFDDDPFEQARELTTALDTELFDDCGDVWGIVCFLHATFELDEERKPPLGTTPLWELSWALDPEGREMLFTPADIEEIAEKVQRVYGRPPIITPNRDRLWEGVHEP